VKKTVNYGSSLEKRNSGPEITTKQYISTKVVFAYIISTNYDTGYITSLVTETGHVFLTCYVGHMF
jgi:hypothetical protein